MKKNRQGIRFEGERRRRIFKRMGIAWGLMAFYSLVFGARLEDGSTSWAGIIVWGLLLLLVIGGFILGREDRNDKRMHQISKEVAEQYPKASDQELYNAYARFRGQEMRMEACLYLGIAAAFGIILLILRRMDAAPVSWLFGTRAALPALLVVSAALFIFSFTQMGINKAIPPLDRFASDPFLRESTRSGWSIRTSGMMAGFHWWKRTASRTAPLSARIIRKRRPCFAKALPAPCAFLASSSLPLFPI